MIVSVGEKAEPRGKAALSQTYTPAAMDPSAAHAALASGKVPP
jgi:hypothetical protein